MTLLPEKLALWVISFSHITYQDSKIITKLEGWRADYASGECSIFYISKELDVFQESQQQRHKEGASPELLRIFSIAFLNNISYIYFDVDGEVIANWPTFNW